jgi:hypothetical protein
MKVAPTPPVGGAGGGGEEDGRTRRRTGMGARPAPLRFLCIILLSATLGHTISANASWAAYRQKQRASM